MEDTEPTATERVTGKCSNQDTDNPVLMNSKPLHRFVQREPRSLGIVVLMFGCAELMMGFLFAGDNTDTSYKIYVPFWLGALFLVCGILSIYTELHPSKKMVTVCLAMYVVSILGIIVSVGYRLHCLGHYASYLSYRGLYEDEKESGEYQVLVQLLCAESILFISSLCVSGILIFLCIFARFALKSTHTQVIVQHIPLPRTDTTAN
ncbi:uncharacterized protein LOC121643608 [Melanotaenia boesemani]|uniref:uncharacterized protein LOC121643608 n=1 Tax=Melanotaenia boesemani TaxID=1250792 RepID=UPI001C058128|nr:uncharacterized protein LOC121643608 [Melanotaenia boesemani]